MTIDAKLDAVLAAVAAIDVRLARVEGEQEAARREQQMILGFTQEAMKNIAAAQTGVVLQAQYVPERNAIVQRVDKIEATSQWLWRTVAGLVFAAAIGMLLYGAGVHH